MKVSNPVFDGDSSSAVEHSENKPVAKLDVEMNKNETRSKLINKRYFLGILVVAVLVIAGAGTGAFIVLTGGSSSTKGNEASGEPTNPETDDSRIVRYASSFESLSEHLQEPECDVIFLESDICIPSQSQLSVEVNRTVEIIGANVNNSDTVLGFCNETNSTSDVSGSDRILEENPHAMIEVRGKLKLADLIIRGPSDSTSNFRLFQVTGLNASLDLDQCNVVSKSTPIYVEDGSALRITNGEYKVDTGHVVQSCEECSIGFDGVFFFLGEKSASQPLVSSAKDLTTATLSIFSNESTTLNTLGTTLTGGLVGSTSEIRMREVAKQYATYDGCELNITVKSDTDSPTTSPTSSPTKPPAKIGCAAEKIVLQATDDPNPKEFLFGQGHLMTFWNAPDGSDAFTYTRNNTDVICLPGMFFQLSGTCLHIVNGTEILGQVGCVTSACEIEVGGNEAILLKHEIQGVTMLVTETASIGELTALGLWAEEFDQESVKESFQKLKLLSCDRDTTTEEPSISSPSDTDLTFEIEDSAIEDIIDISSCLRLCDEIDECAAATFTSDDITLVNASCHLYGGKINTSECTRSENVSQSNLHVVTEPVNPFYPMEPKISCAFSYEPASCTTVKYCLNDIMEVKADVPSAQQCRAWCRYYDSCESIRYWPNNETCVIAQKVSTDCTEDPLEYIPNATNVTFPEVAAWEGKIQFQTVAKQCSGILFNKPIPSLFQFFLERKNRELDSMTQEEQTEFMKEELKLYLGSTEISDDQLGDFLFISLFLEITSLQKFAAISELFLEYTVADISANACERLCEMRGEECSAVITDPNGLQCFLLKNFAEINVDINYDAFYGVDRIANYLCKTDPYVTGYGAVGTIIGMFQLQYQFLLERNLTSLIEAQPLFIAHYNLSIEEVDRDPLGTIGRILPPENYPEGLEDIMAKIAAGDTSPGSLELRVKRDQESIFLPRREYAGIAAGNNLDIDALEEVYMDSFNEERANQLCAITSGCDGFYFDPDENSVPKGTTKLFKTPAKAFIYKWENGGSKNLKLLSHFTDFTEIDQSEIISLLPDTAILQETDMSLDECQRRCLIDSKCTLLLWDSIERRCLFESEVFIRPFGKAIAPADVIDRMSSSSRPTDLRFKREFLSNNPYFTDILENGPLLPLSADSLVTFNVSDESNPIGFLECGSQCAARSECNFWSEAESKCTLYKAKSVFLLPKLTNEADALNVHFCTTPSSDRLDISNRSNTPRLYIPIVEGECRPTNLLYEVTISATMDALDYCQLLCETTYDCNALVFERFGLCQLFSHQPTSTDECAKIPRLESRGNSQSFRASTAYPQYERLPADFCIDTFDVAIETANNIKLEECKARCEQLNECNAIQYKAVFGECALFGGVMTFSVCSLDNPDDGTGYLTLVNILNSDEFATFEKYGCLDDSTSTTSYPSTSVVTLTKSLCAALCSYSGTCKSFAFNDGVCHISQSLPVELGSVSLYSPAAISQSCDQPLFVLWNSILDYTLRADISKCASSESSSNGDRTWKTCLRRCETDRNCHAFNWSPNQLKCTIFSADDFGLWLPSTDTLCDGELYLSYRQYLNLTDQYDYVSGSVCHGDNHQYGERPDEKNSEPFNEFSFSSTLVECQDNCSATKRCKTLSYDGGLCQLGGDKIDVSGDCTASFSQLKLRRVRFFEVRHAKILESEKDSMLELAAPPAFGAIVTDAECMLLCQLESDCVNVIRDCNQTVLDGCMYSKSLVTQESRAENGEAGLTCPVSPNDDEKRVLVQLARAAFPGALSKTQYCDSNGRGPWLTVIAEFEVNSKDDCAQLCFDFGGHPSEYKKFGREATRDCKGFEWTDSGESSQLGSARCVLFKAKEDKVFEHLDAFHNHNENGEPSGEVPHDNVFDCNAVQSEFGNDIPSLKSVRPTGQYIGLGDTSYSSQSPGTTVTDVPTCALRCRNVAGGERSFVMKELTCLQASICTGLCDMDPTLPGAKPVPDDGGSCNRFTDRWWEPACMCLGPTVSVANDPIANSPEIIEQPLHPIIDFEDVTLTGSVFYLRKDNIQQLEADAISLGSFERDIRNAIDFTPGGKKLLPLFNLLIEFRQQMSALVGSVKLIKAGFNLMGRKFICLMDKLFDFPEDANSAVKRMKVVKKAIDKAATTVGVVRPIGSALKQVLQKGGSKILGGLISATEKLTRENGPIIKFKNLVFKFAKLFDGWFNQLEFFIDYFIFLSDIILTWAGYIFVFALEKLKLPIADQARCMPQSTLVEGLDAIDGLLFFSSDEIYALAESLGQNAEQLSIMEIYIAKMNTNLDSISLSFDKLGLQLSQLDRTLGIFDPLVFIADFKIVIPEVFPIFPGYTITIETFEILSLGPLGKFMDIIFSFLGDVLIGIFANLIPDTLIPLPVLSISAPVELLKVLTTDIDKLIKEQAGWFADFFLKIIDWLEKIQTGMRDMLSGRFWDDKPECEETLAKLVDKNNTKIVVPMFEYAQELYEIYEAYESKDVEIEDDNDQNGKKKTCFEFKNPWNKFSDTVKKSKDKIRNVGFEDGLTILKEGFRFFEHVIRLILIKV